MGLAASQARYLMLTARLSDLGFQAQMCSQGRMSLANISGDLFSFAGSLDPEAPEAQALQARIAALQQIDKALELQLNRIQTQFQSCQTEIESVKKLIDQNIDMSFKTFA